MDIRSGVRPFATVVGALLLAVVCGGSASINATATPAATAVPTTSATPAATAGVGAWTITEQSKATVRVREQLVGVSLPSDAVLTTTGGKGSFQLNADGTFAPESKITFDLNTLSSDASQRDNFIKMDTLRVRQFPNAEFVPTKATGVALPLSASGTFSFKLAGNMTIRGTTKEVTFDVEAKRDGGDLTATATASPSWKFADFGMTAPSVPFRVVSIVDEIRVVVDLVATGPKS